MKSRHKRLLGLVIAVLLIVTTLAVFVSANQSPEPLTGNWVVRTPNADSTLRTTYLNLKQEGARIFEDSKVLEIDDERATVTTARGLVRAAHVIVATHTPKGVHLIQSALGPYREADLARRRVPPGVEPAVDDLPPRRRDVVNAHDAGTG